MADAGVIEGRFCGIKGVGVGREEGGGEQEWGVFVRGDFGEGDGFG